VEHSSKYGTATLLIAVLALVAVLHLHLLAALLAGLLLYELTNGLAGRLRDLGMAPAAAKGVALAVVLVLMIILIAGSGVGLYGLFAKGSGNLGALLRKMADALDRASSQFPDWIRNRVPTNTEEFNAAAATWLRQNASALQIAGEGFLRGLTHVVAGIVIGSLAVVAVRKPGPDAKPLLRDAAERLRHFRGAFRGVVFAQIRISALNTLLTGIYLGVVLPAFGIHLPLTKTMIVVTFFAGLLPILGNLISNTIIVIISLSQSIYVALASFGFLIAVHKLEYFVNARIIGGQIRARAWELLLAMLVMDAAFGIPGVIVAPIYYAYLKEELAARGLI
jgi:predicted PurR-regulated permease PerM